MLHNWELYYLPNGLYFCPSTPEIYTAHPCLGTCCGSVTGLIPPPAFDWTVKGEAAD